MPLLKAFLNNNFVLDEHRSTLVALQPMRVGRSNHALHMEGDQIFVLGGMAFREGAKETGQVKSLNSCEVYSITKDEWSDMGNFEHARQQHSVCSFNERFIFIFGGRKLKEGKAKIGATMPFDFVQEVEVYELEKKIWRTLNYIGEP